MKLTCESCGGAFVPVQGNVELEKDGIKVQIIGGKGVGCRGCGILQELDPEIETKVNLAIQRKFKEHPGSRPVLSLNLLA